MIQLVATSHVCDARQSQVADTPIVWLASGALAPIIGRLSSIENIIMMHIQYNSNPCNRTYYSVWFDYLFICIKVVIVVMCAASSLYKGC